MNEVIRGVKMSDAMKHVLKELGKLTIDLYWYRNGCVYASPYVSLDRCAQKSHEILRLLEGACE
jgi:hypothetical protein